MKNLKFFLSLLCMGGALAFVGCNQQAPKEKVAVPQKMVCYRSVSDGDTAWMRIDTASKIIAGTLTYNYTNKKEIYDGQFKGEMYGDTLKGHFDFKINKKDPWFRNPVAFLKRDGKLTMGVGKFMLIMGSAHFDDKVAIDYEKGRFVFEKVACEE